MTVTVAHPYGSAKKKRRHRIHRFVWPDGTHLPNDLLLIGAGLRTCTPFPILFCPPIVFNMLVSIDMEHIHLLACKNVSRPRLSPGSLLYTVDNRSSLLPCQVRPSPEKWPWKYWNISRPNRLVLAWNDKKKYWHTFLDGADRDITP